MRATVSVLALVFAAGPALAQTPGVSSAGGPVPLTGSVPATCTLGSLVGDDDVFALGVMVDTATGFLRSSLSAPPKTLAGAYCNTRSRIEIAATPLLAQDFDAAPPTGFSTTVDFTATASGWTDTPAQFRTGRTEQPDAVQIREASFSGDVLVSISDFATTGGPNIRPVADPGYRGSVVVTLTAAD
jgi:hypothetical protein